jgi:hypothetical protein
VDRHSIGREPLNWMTEEAVGLHHRLTNELATQRQANSSFTVLSAALMQTRWAGHTTDFPKPRHDRADDLKIGMRVRLSPLGIKRSPRVRGSHTGIVISARSRKSVRVLLDGRKKAVTLHVSYIELE